MITRNKRTIMVFSTKEDKRSAEDFLFRINCPFTGSLSRPIISVTCSRYIKNCLDLYLPKHLAVSSFEYKTQKTK